MGEYLGGRVKTDYKCNICGHMWTTTPDTLKVTKYGCPKCATKAAAAKISYTSEYFYERMRELHPTIKVLGQFKNMNTKVSCECLLDGYVWDLIPSHAISRGHGCPKCGGSLPLTNDEFRTRLAEEHPTIIARSNYINDSTKIECKCLVCNNEWKASPTHLHQGRGCPKCAIEARRNHFAKTRSSFISEMEVIDPTIEIIGEYRNSKTKIKCGCSVCGNEWYSTPANLLVGRGCPNCTSSKGERQIAYWLRHYNVLYLREYRFADCTHIRPLPFDFYIPELKTCIEYDGIQHYQPVRFGDTTEIQAIENFESCKERDDIKNKYCKTNNIMLVRIPYWDYNNIQKIIEKLIS